MTALAEAMTTAGIKPNESARLRSVAAQAIRTTKSWDAAKDVFCNLIRNDAALLWEFSQPFRLQAIQALLTEASTRVREGGAQPRLIEREPNFGRERPITSGRSALSAAASIASLSLLDTFKIGGRPVGDCTPRAANKAAEKRAVESRFIRLLTQNLPLDEPIRKYRKPEDAAACMTEAQKDDEE